MGVTKLYPCCLELMRWTSDKFSSPLPLIVQSCGQGHCCDLRGFGSGLAYLLEKSVILKSVIFYNFEHPLTSSWFPRIVLSIFVTIELKCRWIKWACSPNIPLIWRGVYFGWQCVIVCNTRISATRSATLCDSSYTNRWSVYPGNRTFYTDVFRDVAVRARVATHFAAGWPDVGVIPPIMN